MVDLSVLDQIYGVWDWRILNRLVLGFGLEVM